MYSFSFSDNFSGRNLVWMKRGDSRAIKIKTEDQIWSLFGDDVRKEVLKHGKNHKFEFHVTFVIIHFILLVLDKYDSMGKSQLKFV